MRTDLPGLDVRKTYNYDDYRKEIAEIMERNGKRIKITEILKQCKISKGNYYLFMNGGKEYSDGKVTNTLSYAKLDLLLDALINADVYSTNRKKLEAMSDEKLAEFIENKFIRDPDAENIDVLKWLKSHSEEMVYKK